MAKRCVNCNNMAWLTDGGMMVCQKTGQMVEPVYLCSNGRWEARKSEVMRKQKAHKVLWYGRKAVWAMVAVLAGVIGVIVIGTVCS